MARNKSNETTKTKTKVRNKKLTTEELDEVDELISSKFHTEKGKFDYTVDLKCKTENQKKFINLIKSKTIAIGAGYAGTGKSLISCAEALRQLKNNISYKKIVLIKSVTTLQGEEIGFLKGGMDEKIAPFLMSYKYTFEKIIGEAYTKVLFDSNTIQFIPLAYVRGISIDNSIIIVDEAQNLSMDNMETILTRVGENSKLIVIGDERQIDLAKKKESSLSYVIEKFEKINHPEIGTCRFELDDIVRNPIIKVIESIFDEHREEKENNKNKTNK